MQRDVPDGYKTHEDDTCRRSFDDVATGPGQYGGRPGPDYSEPNGLQALLWLAPRSRASSFLAGWDTWRPGDGAGHRKAGATATRECELCRLARAQVALRTKSRRPRLRLIQRSDRASHPTSPTNCLRSANRGSGTHAVSDTVITFEPIDVDDEIWGRTCVRVESSGRRARPRPECALRPSHPRIPTSRTQRAKSINLEWIDERLRASGSRGTVRRHGGKAKRTAQPVQTAEAPASTAMREQHEQPTATAGALVRSEILSDDVSTSVEWSSGYGPDLFAAIENQLANIDTNNPPATAHKATSQPFVSASTQPEIRSPTHRQSPAAQNDVQQEDTASSQIPWPVFAPEQSVVQPATRVTEEIQVPWPVFAPSEQSPDEAIAISSGSNRCRVSRAGTRQWPRGRRSTNSALTDAQYARLTLRQASPRQWHRAGIVREWHVRAAHVARCMLTGGAVGPSCSFDTRGRGCVDEGASRARARRSLGAVNRPSIGDCSARPSLMQSTSIDDDSARHGSSSMGVIPRWLLVNNHATIAECSGNLEHFTVGWEALARALLESLHRVHELHFFDRVLFLKGCGIDAPPPFLLGALLGRDGTGGVRVRLLAERSVVTPFASRSPFMKYRVGRKGGKIEFLGPWFRLIIVVAHALKSRIPWVELVLAMKIGV